jgi:hypothetical protein
MKRDQLASMMKIDLTFAARVAQPKPRLAGELARLDARLRASLYTADRERYRR